MCSEFRRPIRHRRNSQGEASPSSRVGVVSVEIYPLVVDCFGWRGAVGAGVVLVLGFVLSGCAAGSSRAEPNAQVIVAATSGADTARSETIVDVGDGKTLGRVEFSSLVDFANRRGDMVGHLLAAASTSSRTSNVVSETRWIGDDVYINQGAPIGSPHSDWVLVNGARVHAAAPCLAKDDVVSELAESVSPTGELDALRQEGLHLSRVGIARIRGVSTTHWRSDAHTTDWQPFSGSCDPGHTSASTTTGQDRVDVYTDSHNRARRLKDVQIVTTRLSGRLETHSFKQTITESIDFFDFGTPVAVVAPPVNRVTDLTSSYVAEKLGSGSVKSSDWHEIAHGAIGSTPWKIDAAHTSTGWNCFDLNDTPGVSQSNDANGDPKHNGHATNCLVPKDWIGETGESGPIALFIDTVASGKSVLVGTVTGIGAPRLHFADGSVQSLTVDPATLLFSWSGPATQSPVRIQVGDESCRLGTQVMPDQPDWTLSTRSTCTEYAP
jgi:hypothetical protein